MLDAAYRLGARLLRLLLLLAAARFATGLALIAIFDRGSVAWGWQATAVVLASAAVYLAAALALRRA
ncbi:MAG TPA: hypothetical protein VFC53_13345 [Dehalococcoidia bacterium]|nr:hypothetical protein [Dehalococcoidia bacterium]